MARIKRIFTDFLEVIIRFHLPIRSTRVLGYEIPKVSCNRKSTQSCGLRREI